MRFASGSLAVVLLCPLFVLTAFAQDVTGTWEVSQDVEGARGLALTYLLAQNADQIEGVWKRQDLDDITFHGTASGNVVTFAVSFPILKGSNRGRSVTLAHTGIIDGDLMSGTFRVALEDQAALGPARVWSARRVQTSDPEQRQGATGSSGSAWRVSALPSEQLGERFEAALNRLQESEGFPGAVAAFQLGDGRSAVVASGYADQEAQRPMTPDSRMLIGSIGKTFVAAVALDLEQEGKLNLKDPISTWLGDEEWFSRLPNAEHITLRMLLNHTSGLIDHAHDPRFVQAVREKAEHPSTNRDFVLAPRELVEFVLDREPLFAAGAGYNYTDTGYILAGLIIEKAANSTYYEQLQARFLDPLSLQRTDPSDQRDLAGLVPGYMDPGNPLGLPEKTMEGGELVFSPATEWTGGGLASNPKDLVNWVTVLYEGTAMVGPYVQDLLGSSWKGRRGRTRYGLGVSISESELGTTYGHDGWFPGYRSKVTYFPAYGIAAAIQVNTDVEVDLGSYIFEVIGVLLEDERE
ncbi:MAG: serine hydrolase domain-containing protein [Gemmatimonadota bacterium]